MKIGKTLLVAGTLVAGVYAANRFLKQPRIREWAANVVDAALAKVTGLADFALTKYDEATQGAFSDDEEPEKEDPWRSATRFNGNDSREDDAEEARR